MPLDMQKLAGAPGIRCAMQERWTIDGHEVALVIYKKRGGRGPGNAYLACECDTDTEDVVRDGKVVGHTCRHDPHKCAAKAAVRAQVTERVRPSVLAVREKQGLEAAVLDVHSRVKAGEWLGQTHQGVIYAQEVAALLNEQLPAVLAAIESLYAKESLDLNGMIICDYVPGFRFPKEVRSMLRMMVETPLGWPNGDAGEGVLAELERAVTKGTRYKRCADAFWDHNWPRVAPWHLVEFGITFLSAAHGRAASDPAVRKELGNLGGIQAALTRLAAEYGALNDDMPPTPPKKRRTKRKPSR